MSGRVVPDALKQRSVFVFIVATVQGRMECFNLEAESHVSVFCGMSGTVNPITQCHIPRDPDLQIYCYFTLLNCCIDYVFVVFMYKESG